MRHTSSVISHIYFLHAAYAHGSAPQGVYAIVVLIHLDAVLFMDKSQCMIITLELHLYNLLE